MNLAALLADQTFQRPHAPAIIEQRGCKTHITSFAELNQRSLQAAAALAAHGVEAGDTILVFQPMSAELYAAILGILAIGGVAMFLDPYAGMDHINACCEIRPPKALIAKDKAHLLRFRSSALRRIPHKFSIGWPVPGAVSWSRITSYEMRNELFTANEDTPALITFTSGSTGRPKAAVRTHGFLLAQHRVLERSLELVPGEIDLTTLPIFLLANLASGVTSVIPNAELSRPAMIKPEPVLHQISAHGVTRCAASPAFLQRLLAGTNREPGAFSSLRKIYTGGAPVFPKLLEALTTTASDAKVYAVYGSTEAEPIAHISTAQITCDDRRMMQNGSGLLTGKPVPEIRLRIIKNHWGLPLINMDEATFAGLNLAPREVGEIVICGNHVLPGYLDGHGDEETKFRVNGELWHRTGDAGWLDEEGRLWLMGRCGSKIERRSGTLWPFSVECAAQECMGVKHAALVEHKGRHILAIEAVPGHATDIPDSIQTTVPWAKLDDLVMVKRLPVDKRHNSKIVYDELIELLDRRIS